MCCCYTAAKHRSTLTRFARLTCCCVCLQKYNLWGDPLLVIMVPFVVAIAYITGWILLWIALKVGQRRNCLSREWRGRIDYGQSVANHTSR